MSFSFNAPTEAAISFGSLFGPQLEIAPIARGSEDLTILKGVSANIMEAHISHFLRQGVPWFQHDRRPEDRSERPLIHRQSISGEKR